MIRYHHTASRRGYASRKPDAPVRIEPYKGLFGEGFIRIEPRWDTTRYVNVSYYIDDGLDDEPEEIYLYRED